MRTNVEITIEELDAVNQIRLLISITFKREFEEHDDNSKLILELQI